MSLFQAIKNRMKGKHHSSSLLDLQQWSYYQDLTAQPNHPRISRYSHLHRSLYNLIYTPNDELNYFILYMDSCALSSCLKFILDVDAFDRIIRENSSERDVNDDQQTTALILFHRYLSVDATYSVPIDDDIRRTTLSFICPMNDCTKPDPDCFRVAREHIWKLIEHSAYPAYLHSTHQSTYQLKILTSNQLQLHDILYHDLSLSYFTKFAEEENFLDLLQFWIDVERFHQNIINQTMVQKSLQENALEIYEQYISLQAPVRLGFDNAIRTRIECSICQVDMDAGPSMNTFDQAVWIVYEILQREYFPRFLRSAIFYQYLNDLMSKHSVTPVKRSNSTDTISIDSEIRSFNRQENLSESSSCSSIPTTVHSKGRLSVGYIDPLGRFIRDPEIDSHCSYNRANSSKPLQFLNRLIRNESDELATEEAAARFAELFIKEITDHSENLHYK